MGTTKAQKRRNDLAFALACRYCVQISPFHPEHHHADINAEWRILVAQAQAARIDMGHVNRAIVDVPNEPEALQNAYARARAILGRLGLC